MDWVVDGYIRAIVKEGNPPEHEVLKAAGELRIQYADAVGDAEYRMYISVIKEVSALEITLAQISELVKIMEEAYHPVLGRELNKLISSALVFDPTNREAYTKNLQRALNRSKGYKIRLDLKRMELAKLETKYKASGSNPTREYYMGVLLTVSSTQGYKVSTDITVWEFCELLKRHNKAVDQIKTKQDGRRTH